MLRRPATPLSDEELHEVTHGRDTPRGYGSDEDDVCSSWSRTSSRSSVDTMLIEQFSGSDSSSNPSLQGQQSPASNLDSADNRGPAHGWISKLGRGARRSAAKRKATKLLDELIQADNTKDGQVTARQRRSNAAAGLVKIIENKPSGKEIVARRFVKTASRQDQGTQALIRLSDDELDLLGFKAVSPVSKPLAFTKLLDVVVKHTSESQFFRRTISTALTDGEKGVAAILYLATTATRNFFLDIDPQILISFCNRVIKKEAPFCPKWYCGAQLLGILLQNISASSKTKYRPLIMETLPSICEELIRDVTTIVDPNMPGKLRKDPVLRGAPFHFLIAVCCDTITPEKAWSYFPTLSAVNIFINWLISFADYRKDVLLINDALALSTLRSLVRNHLIVSAIPEDTLTKIGTIFLNMPLHPPLWYLPEGEKIFIRHLKTDLDESYIHSLCCLPQSTFSNVLASALNKGSIGLNSLESRNSYEPFGLVERLLWLSNLREPPNRPERVLHALIGGGACEFLSKVLSHTGDFSPQDRGLWRAKGLAMTCLGNIVERMDEDQLRNHATKEIIDVVVAIKGHEDVPLVQKGQAIFMLQRYTLAADRWGVRPHYREDTSNMDEGFRSVNAGGSQSP